MSWLSKDDQERIAQYRFYENIFDGKHDTAFAKFSAEMVKKKKLLIYIICNFGALISKVSADLLFSEPINLKWRDGVNDKTKKTIDDFIVFNNFNTELYESALTNSYMGDIVLKLRRDEKGNIISDFISPEIYIPEFDPDNAREPLSHTLAWVKTAGDKRYLRKEVHTKGIIRNELFLLKDDDSLGSQVDLKTFYANLPEEQKTGVDDFLIKVIPNWRKATKFFGISDYNDIIALFDEINNRMSRVAGILDKHSDPKLAVPPGVLDDRGMVKGGNFDLIEVSGNNMDGGLNKPEYITWDASLDAAFKEIDKLIDFLFLFSETSPAAFGLDKGGVAESGRALKFKLIRTMAKISRKQNYYREGINWAFTTAQKLKGVTPELPYINWQDGIPQDTYEQAQIEQMRLQAGNTSKESSIKRLDNYDDEELKAEIGRIREDEQAITSGIGNTPPSVTL